MPNWAQLTRPLRRKYSNVSNTPRMYVRFTRSSRKAMISSIVRPAAASLAAKMVNNPRPMVNCCESKRVTFTPGASWAPSLAAFSMPLKEEAT